MRKIEKKKKRIGGADEAIRVEEEMETEAKVKGAEESKRSRKEQIVQYCLSEDGKAKKEERRRGKRHNEEEVKKV